MRRFAVVVLAAVAAVLALPVGSARAGGPTSVLVVNHEEATAAAAVTGSTVYDALVRSLDAMSPPAGEQRPPADSMAASLRLTWLIHDVTPWRVDGLVIDGQDVWVSTTMSSGTAELFEQDAVWHRPADARLLLATLTSLGAIGDSPTSAQPTVGGTVGDAVAPAEAPGAARPAAPDPTDEATVGAPLGSAALLGLLVGVLGTIVVGRLAPRGRSSGHGSETTTPARRQAEAATACSSDASHLATDIAPVGFSDDPATLPLRAPTGAS
ncbi:hypothetical protein OO014_11450 [Intrasporangium calvum]|uniref:Uncharacterized protein n=1 Tax=Intrasporangium calvum TaxID=53358 RepID=A0ABT5GIB9_9MICO|nr:hypothetical protein [Intrasporangium calvum]MDC5697877.1 hypothetical protein [Intrasporangium calvum]